MTARGTALEALRRIEEGAYANLVLPGLLASSRLDERDRRFCTDLVYGTTRMRAACDFLVDRFLADPAVDAGVRSLLRLGAYQLHFQGLPPHAAVSATVDEAPKRTKGLVNAVLRRVSTAGVEWPDEHTRLSYPRWIVDRLRADLGAEDAIGALEAMNAPAHVHQRDDGYVQDPASRDIVALAAAGQPALVVDLCAAPGGKATALAGRGAFVVAGDLHRTRAGLIATNARSTGTAERIAVLSADGLRPPIRPGTADVVLVDAPCSGLGVLRRRPDARWRIREDDIAELADLQHGLVAAATTLLRSGGRLVYSVCTLTEAEGPSMGARIASSFPTLTEMAPDSDTWSDIGTGWRRLDVGARRLPVADGPGEGDGMYAAVFTMGA